MYKTNFITLVNSYNDDEDALDLIETNMNNLNGYVSAVYAMDVQIPTYFSSSRSSRTVQRDRPWKSSSTIAMQNSATSLRSSRSPE